MPDHVVTIDNYLTPAQIDDWIALRVGYEELEIKPHTTRKKLHMPQNHPLVQAFFDQLATTFTQPWFSDLIEPWCDYAWRCVYNQSPGEMEIGLSRYAPNGTGYRWHVDHADGLRRILNFMVSLKTVPGGEIEYTDEPMHPRYCVSELPPEEQFQPKHTLGRVGAVAGRLVLMPAHYPHRVLPSPEMRISLHGHVKL